MAKIFGTEIMQDSICHYSLVKEIKDFTVSHLQVHPSLYLASTIRRCKPRRPLSCMILRSIGTDLHFFQGGGGGLKKLMTIPNGSC